MQQHFEIHLRGKERARRLRSKMRLSQVVFATIALVCAAVLINDLVLGQLTFGRLLTLLFIGGGFGAAFFLMGLFVRDLGVERVVFRDKEDGTLTVEGRLGRATIWRDQVSASAVEGLLDRTEIVVERRYVGPKRVLKKAERVILRTGERRITWPPEEVEGFERAHRELRRRASPPSSEPV